MDWVSSFYTAAADGAVCMDTGQWWTGGSLEITLITNELGACRVNLLMKI